VRKAAGLLRKVLPQAEDTFAKFEKERADRIRQEENLQNAARNLARLESELKEIGLKIERLGSEMADAEKQSQAAGIRAADLEAKLAPFAKLENELKEQLALKDKSAEDHKAYLGARPLAAKADERRKALKDALELEGRAQEELRQRTKHFEEADKAFDAIALENARTAAITAEVTMARETQKLKEATADLKQEKERLRQWKEACAERDRIETETGRLNAASSLARLAAKVLKDAAPAVAQHLCSRIAANAQRLFNQISQDTIELEWKAEPQYSLRITPGDRRFAMLSGGEQTKLALAMTLAMIQEFSGLRFAVFDEPTYAVDGESRQKLAEAIMDVQKASGLDQMIVVSHDDSFEGKIEHVVMLTKRAGVGTEVVATG